MTNYRLLRRGSVPWGDYGAVLLHGTVRRERVDGELQLERTGPFVPPMMIPYPNHVLVAANLKSRLEQSGLSGCGFKPVRLATVVRLAWEPWDRNVQLPEELPPFGEPENYLDASRHDSELASEMPTIWELDPPHGGEGRREILGFKQYRFEVRLGLMPALDFMRVRGLTSALVSERAQHWLAREVGESVAFQDVELVFPS